MKKRFTYGFFIALVMTCMLLLFALLTQTTLFKTWLRDAVVSIASQELRGNLEIGRIEGPLFGELQIHGARLVQDGDTIFAFGELQISFDLQALLERTVLVRELQLAEPSIHLRQFEDGSWNIEHLLRAPLSEEESVFLSWRILVRSLRIRSGRARIEPLDPKPLYPVRVRKLDLDLDGRWRRDVGECTVRNVSVTSDSDFPEVLNLSLHATLLKDTLTIDTLFMATAENRYGADMKIQFAGSPVVRGTVAISEFDPVDIRHWIGNPGIMVTPDVRADLIIDPDSILISAAVSSTSGQVELIAQIETRDEVPGYDATVRYSDLRPSDWLLSLQDADGTALNGTASVRGHGTDPKALSAEFRIGLQSSVLLNKRITALSCEGRYSARSLQAVVSAEADAGTVEARIEAYDIPDRISYTIAAVCNDINLAELTGIDTLQSALNLKLDLEGKDFDPHRASLKARVQLGPSRFMGHELDSSDFTVYAENGLIVVDSCIIESQNIRLTCRGQMRLPDSLDFIFTAEVPELQQVASRVGVDTLRGSAILRCEGGGTTKILSGRYELTGSGIGISSAAADSLSVSGSFNIMDDSTLVSASLAAKKIHLGAFTIDSCRVLGSYDGNAMYSDFLLHAADSVHLSGTAKVTEGIPRRISLSRLQLSAGSTSWSQDSLNATLELDSAGAEFTDFSIVSGQQRISARGRIEYADTIAFELLVDSLQLSDIMSLTAQTVPLKALLSAEVGISGSIDNPAGRARVYLTDVTFSTVARGDVDLDLELRDSVLTWSGSVATGRGHNFSSEGMVPIHLPWSGVPELLDDTRDVNATLFCERFDLSVLPGSLIPIDALSGIVKCDLRLHGSLAAPELSGQLRLDSGALSWQRYGIDYRGFSMQIRGDGPQLAIDSVHMTAGRGELRAEGYMFHDSRLSAGDLGRSSMRLTSSDFGLMQGPAMEADADMDIRLSSINDSLLYEGTLRINRSRLWLPAVMSHIQTENEAEIPLLLQAVHADSINGGNSSTVAVNVPLRKRPIQGTLQVALPRNSWVQSPELNIEVEGNVDLVYANSEPGLIGYIKIVRGTYFFLGKKFTVKAGQLNFKGGKEFDPVVQLEVEHRFRDASRELSELVANVSGTAKHPVVRFSVKDEPVTEADAVSYVLFGRSTDELSQGEKNMVGNETVDMAGNILASRLTSSLGSALGIDVVELQGEESWQRATFTAGKYLTDDLFVSYTRGFGEGDNNDINTETVTLEYEITPFLYIQLTEGTSKQSGIDLIIKLD